MSKITFGEVLYIKGRIGWQALKKDEYLENGEYYLVTGIDITDDNRINFEQCYYVSKERYEMDVNIQLQEGDIIVTKDGTIGKIGLIDKLDKPATLNSHLFLIRNLKPDILDTNFLFYILKSDIFQKYAINNTTGSNIPAFTQKFISEFQIELPEMSIQKKIAKILSNIDEKLRNNNKINNNLEKLMKTLYQRWFIEFEFPNEDGKPYKTCGGRFMYNEDFKKDIPYEWNVSKFSDVTEMYQPKTIPTNELISDGQYNVFGANGIIGKYDKYNHEENEIAVCCRGAACGEYLMTLPFSWITGNAMVIKPKGNKQLKEYIYYKLGDKDIFNYVTGSAQPQITRSNIENMKIIIPSKKILEQFDSIAVNYRKVIINNLMENERISSLKDFLLPMLMNGQINVDDIEI